MNAVRRTALGSAERASLVAVLLLTTIVYGFRIMPGAGAMAPVQAEQSAAKPNTTRFEVRLAEADPGPGLIAATVSTLNLHIYLHETPVITNHDVVQAFVVESRGRCSIPIALSPEGEARMAAATAAHIGKPLAFIVNGVVVTAPIVGSAIRDVVMTGDFTREQADSIAAGLQR